MKHKGIIIVPYAMVWVMTFTPVERSVFQYD